MGRVPARYKTCTVQRPPPPPYVLPDTIWAQIFYLQMLPREPARYSIPFRTAEYFSFSPVHSLPLMIVTDQTVPKQAITAATVRLRSQQCVHEEIQQVEEVLLSAISRGFLLLFAQFLTQLNGVHSPI